VFIEKNYMNKKAFRPEFSVKIAHEAQLRLSNRILFEDKLSGKIRLVGGVDVAYVGESSIGAVAILDFDTLELVESQTACCKTCFPYVPTLLSFREIMPSVLCIRKLNVQPDVFLADGHGFAHPYRCGFASHLGLVIGKPTVGVAKHKLIGEVETDDPEKAIAFMRHNDEVIGAAITTERGSRPMYVSVGHMVSLDTAIRIVRHCTSANRVPEPIVKAHQIADAAKRKINILSPNRTGFE
jgi:deoxyribonuclease V